MGFMYGDVIKDLRTAYDASVTLREGHEPDGWKITERWRVLERLTAAGTRTLLEIGAGTGVHGRFFADQGLDVTSTDLSPAMVAACHMKGLTAYERDFLHLDVPGSPFDAVFAMNCLLHVPRADFAAVLRSIQGVLKPGGLFYLGQYGGIVRESAWEHDTYEPKRFFSYLTDEALLSAVGAVYSLDDFRTIDLESSRGDLHFQALMLTVE